MTVTMKKIGGSIVVAIPEAVASDLGWVEGTALELSAQGNAIVMRKPDHRPHRKLSSIVSQIKPASYRRRRVELLDEPVGKELWLSRAPLPMTTPHSGHRPDDARKS
jgi:antitoxin component of MazEF toxin-antitoxin module